MPNPEVLIGEMPARRLVRYFGIAGGMVGAINRRGKVVRWHHESNALAPLQKGGGEVLAGELAELNRAKSVKKDRGRVGA